MFSGDLVHNFKIYSFQNYAVCVLAFIWLRVDGRFNLEKIQMYAFSNLQINYL